MALDKYKVRILQYKLVDNIREYYTSCTCGRKEVVGNTLSYSEREKICKTPCPCGAKKTIEVEKGRRVNIPYIKVLDKSRRGFKLQRVNLSVFGDKDGNVKWKENTIRVINFDIPTNKLEVFKNGEHTHKYFVEHELKHFFVGLNHVHIKNEVSVPETQTLYDFIWRKLSYPKSRAWNSESRFYLGLIKFTEENFGYLQILASAGYPQIERFYEPYSRWHTCDRINKEGTNPKDILQIPKFMLPYFRQDDRLGLYNLEQIQKALKKVDGNRFREVFEIIKDESTIGELCQTLDKLIEIHDTYKYNNLKKLTLYLFREIRMHQGIGDPSHGATLLRDYIRMSTRLELDFEKYPKSLKKEHDITQMNYKVQESEIKRKEFKQAVENEEYAFLEYKKREYSIIPPVEMDDLIKEGNDLSHCVASYVNDVVSDRCKILFLRKSKDLESPLATVEIRGGNIRQARGYANRRLTQDELGFLRDWAKEKELNVSYY
ncbi:PcfJ-like protein [Bacillus phage vB_BanS_Nate]|uniref:PcfJ-like protein n=1 Tax=Bacillus phage vB_BanS_Nate TaxID=2894788 RepID=A0AAE8YY53_9CAUD|nr:PcfJ-like protein [Bacillus phage vB_BanS_Nate]UGO50997.1 PcfJ-like protein [Bacillus phage vB_BanS_Nate]